jgi:cell division septation protein DedD
MAEGQDTEITLGTGRLLGLFFGLVVVCGVFFGLGFSLGRNSVKAGALTMEETPASTPLPQSSAVSGKSGAGTPEKTASPNPVDPPAADSSQAAASNNAPAPVVVSPATAENASTAPAPEMAKPVAVSTGAAGYTVQVAAVSKQEDADALVDALKKKSYPVFVASANADKLFHVQIGPFGDIKDAEAMKAKLLGDGYNPIVKR